METQKINNNFSQTDAIMPSEWVDPLLQHAIEIFSRLIYSNGKQQGHYPCLQSSFDTLNLKLNKKAQSETFKLTNNQNLFEKQKKMRERNEMPYSSLRKKGKSFFPFSTNDIVIKCSHKSHAMPSHLASQLITSLLVIWIEASN